jgi:para-nitrobenzyl esterase
MFVLFIALSLANPNIVNTASGTVQGFLDGGVRKWLGIPYAAPPLGELRFAPPKPAAQWSGVLQCNAEQEICPQLDVDGFFVGNEDCLYLDVYTPENVTSDAALPVMVWIYGGGLTLGDKYFWGMYDATNLVIEHGHVHVAMNYRLNAFGFLALQALLDEDPNHTTGNYGFQDQRLALQWIQQNIASFGGDPTRVTIFGESAGAMSVCSHLTSPLSKGLFSGAIMESGNCQADGFYPTLEQSITFGYEWSVSTGCTQNSSMLSCLRSLSTETILNSMDIPSNSPFIPSLYPAMPWGFTIDGTPNMPSVPYKAILSGSFNRVPVILGSNNNEGAAFIPLVYQLVPNATIPLDQASVTSLLLHFFNRTSVDSLLKLYASESTWEGTVSQGVTDWFFACSARRVARSLAEQQNPVWLYHFDYLPSWWIDDWVLGDYHSAEIDFVFSNAWPPLVHPFNEADQQMADSFGRYWLSMAFNGSPNSGTNTGNIEWPEYSASTLLDMEMSVPLAVEYNYRSVSCDVWDTVVELH